MRTKVEVEVRESEVIHLLLARRENYRVGSVSHAHGRIWEIALEDKHYNAVVLLSSFEYWTRRYHLIASPPDLVVCMEHTTVLPCDCLSLERGNMARPFEMPEQFDDIAAQRFTKVGSQVLLGMYLCGLRMAQSIVADLPRTTRRRYIDRAKALSRRTRGRPPGKIAEGKAPRRRKRPPIQKTRR